MFKKVKIGKAGKILLYIVLIFILGEFVTRVLNSYFVKGKIGLLYSYVVSDGDSWNFQPGITVIQQERYGDRSYTFNNYGYLGQNIDLNNNTRKILLLGDSVTFGLGVRYDFTYPSLVEKALNEANEIDIKYEVINLALPSYSPHDEIVSLKRIGLKLQPKLILLQIYMNDFQMNKNKQSCNIEQPNLVKVSLSQRFFILKEMVFSSSAFLQRVRQACQILTHRMLHDVRRKYFVNTLNYNEPKERKELFISCQEDRNIDGFDDIEEMYKLAKERKIDFLVVLTPNEVQLFNEDYNLINKRVHEFCESKNIPFFDPLNDMRSSNIKEKIFCDGLHLSEIGHKFLADWLLPIVKSSLNADKNTLSNSW